MSFISFVAVILQKEMGIEMSKINTFQTSDLYLAAVLKINGFRLIDLTKNRTGRGIFSFEDRPDRPQIVRDYFGGELKGSLKAFASAWSDLKALVMEV